MAARFTLLPKPSDLGHGGVCVGGVEHGESDSATHGARWVLASIQAQETAGSASPGRDQRFGSRGEIQPYTRVLGRYLWQERDPRAEAAGGRESS